MKLNQFIKVLKSRLKIFIILSILFLAQVSLAQDFHLSQYDASPLYLNPSLTGFFFGYYRLHAHYRTQWASLVPKPFTTSQVAYDQSLGPVGLGAQVMDYRAGAGGYNVFNFSVSGAYDYAFDFLQHHHLCM